MKNFVVYLDAGHGGIGLDNEYTTAPDKQYRHRQGEFHGDGWFYEGVWNRVMTYLIAAKLDHLGIRNMIISHPWLDLDLYERCDRVNWYVRNYAPGVLLSIHANSSPGHNARGYEVFTSPGVTRADLLATLHYESTRSLLGDRIRYRADWWSDGDPDKEAKFTMLTRTIPPAILIEHLFFDQYDDARMLMDSAVRDLFAEASIRAITKYLDLHE